MMGRIAWLPIFLILVVSCQGCCVINSKHHHRPRSNGSGCCVINSKQHHRPRSNGSGVDVTTSKRPAHLSGVKDQTFHGSITTAKFLNSFQHSIEQALDILENRIEAQLIQLQDGIKEELSLLQTFLNNENELQKSRTEEKFSQLEKAFNDKLYALENKMEDRFKSVDEKLQLFVRRASCHRGMSSDNTKEYQALELMRDSTLNRDILCDTKTDGGGWIVFQRRTKFDVDFDRTWEDYKNGFGSPPGDFWLGNEAIHNLTSKDSYELRIELTVGSRILFAVYSSFRLESEADNYRLRLGSPSGTLEEEHTHSGLSHSNGSQFCTYDKDNDYLDGVNCAEVLTGAWWYKECTSTYLNGNWRNWRWEGGIMWDTGSTFIHGDSTEMKIRLI